MNFEHDFPYDMETRKTSPCTICEREFIEYSDQGACLTLEERFEQIEQKLKNHIANHSQDIHMHSDLDILQRFD